MEGTEVRFGDRALAWEVVEQEVRCITVDQKIGLLLLRR